MQNKIHRNNSINIVFGDPNLVLSILSFLYEETNKSLEFLTNTPIALHILSFKSLYYEFHKLPNLQITSKPIQYLSSFSVFQWAIAMGYSGNIFNPNDLFDYYLYHHILKKHFSESIHFIDYTMTKISSYYHYCSIAIYAIKYGYIHLLEQINSKNTSFKWDNMVALEIATENGHLHIIQWLQKQEPPCRCPYIYEIAAKYGHLHILQWLRAQNPPCPWKINECIKVVKPENSHILEWLEAQT
jgi:hypothetical protein